MYTQCTHCKAIFRVNIREVTVAKGQLRCGECNTIFNSTKSLSTSLPPSFEELEAEREPNLLTVDKPEETRHSGQNIEHVIKSNSVDFSVETSVKETRSKKPRKTTNQANKGYKWLLVSTLLLLSLLLTQVFYNNRHYFLGTALHQPEKIQMLNHNIFAHPNESGVLLISALIENSADHAQPYPALELRLEDAQSKPVAFRRFMPKEYLPNYSQGILIPPNTPISLKLKIKDPGNNATRFQFKFL